MAAAHRRKRLAGVPPCGRQRSRHESGLEATLALPGTIADSCGLRGCSADHPELPGLCLCTRFSIAPILACALCIRFSIPAAMGLLALLNRRPPWHWRGSGAPSPQAVAAAAAALRRADRRPAAKAEKAAVLSLLARLVDPKAAGNSPAAAAAAAAALSDAGLLEAVTAAVHPDAQPSEPAVEVGDWVQHGLGHCAMNPPWWVDLPQSSSLPPSIPMRRQPPILRQRWRPPRPRPRPRWATAAWWARWPRCWRRPAPTSAQTQNWTRLASCAGPPPARPCETRWVGAGRRGGGCWRSVALGWRYTTAAAGCACTLQVTAWITACQPSSASAAHRLRRWRRRARRRPWWLRCRAPSKQATGRWRARRPGRWS